MRLHRSTSQAVVDALDAIFTGNRYADKVIEKMLKQNPKWGARDRRFIAETTYGIVRWYALLLHVTAAKQGDHWRLLGGWCALRNIELPPWEEFKGLVPGRVRSEESKARAVRHLRESIPQWMDSLGEKELGKHWEKELRSLNEEAHVVLRANTLKISQQKLQRALEEEGIATHPVANLPDALQLEHRQNIFGSAAFKEGLFEVQDAASQEIVPFMRIEPGLRVIDACAGAGGKTLHLAAMMKNKGRIIAMDVEQWKLEELQRRARRAGVSNMEVKLIDSSKVIKRLEASSDRLLLDVPCSGMGVLRRNPDAKWKLSPEFLDNVKALQRDILKDYSVMVKPGGLMVYSTCSILPSENEEQVKQFLTNNAGHFELVEEKRCWPSDGYDGFYMALLRRLK